jgi:hypothetical protein
VTDATHGRERGELFSAMGNEVYAAVYRSVDIIVRATVRMTMEEHEED